MRRSTTEPGLAADTRSVDPATHQRLAHTAAGARTGCVCTVSGPGEAGAAALPALPGWGNACVDMGIVGPIVVQYFNQR